MIAAESAEVPGFSSIKRWIFSSSPAARPVTYSSLSSVHRQYPLPQILTFTFCIVSSSLYLPGLLPLANAPGKSPEPKLLGKRRWIKPPERISFVFVSSLYRFIIPFFALSEKAFPAFFTISAAVSSSPNSQSRSRRRFFSKRQKFTSKALETSPKGSII